MWIRCKNPEHSRYKTYKDCEIDERYRYLSNYINDVMKLENFDKLCQDPSKWHIDKDVKDPTNRHYTFNHLSIIYYKDNSKERMQRLGSPNMGNFKPIIGINKDTNSIILLKSRNEAKEKGFRPSNITLVCQGKRPHHKGYKWFYINYKHNKTYRRV